MDTLAKLTAIFRDVFDDEHMTITPESNAQDYDEWDSLTHIQLIVETERSFGIKFTTSEISALKNVGDFIRLIESKVRN